MQRTRSISKVHRQILGITLFLGPVYWFPGVPVAIVPLIKAASLATAIALLFLERVTWQTKIPLTLVLSFLILLTVSAFASLLNQNTLFTAYIGAFVFLILGMVYAGVLGKEAIISILVTVAIFFTVFPALVVLDFLLGGVFRNPLELFQPFLHLTGFQSGRTGWAATNNYFIAILFARMLLPTSTSLAAGLAICVAIYSLNILVVGSRGGLLVAGMLTLIFLLIQGYRDKKTAFITFAAVCIIAFSFVSMFQDRLIDTRLYLSIIAPEELTYGFTTGRIDGFYLAMELFSTSPIFGNGDVDMRDFGANVEEVHNVWLRALVESGLLVLLALVFFVFAVGTQVGTHADKHLSFAIFLGTAGLSTSLFEPTAVFGNYFASSIFWIAIGCLCTNQIVRHPSPTNAATHRSTAGRT